MTRAFRLTHLYLLAAFSLLLSPSPVLACATCFGKSDSKMAEGMNMGILSLLVVITTVLFAMACFFVFLAKRATAAPASEQVDALK
ncbi:MAG: hypothetical protein H7X97_12930 [Opitutaceae bacterium]|nr:hypothetical protein [Verrucomicrobiales bacterium]